MQKISRLATSCGKIRISSESEGNDIRNGLWFPPAADKRRQNQQRKQQNKDYPVFVTNSHK